MNKYYLYIKDLNSWKTFAILSGISFLFLILLDSILFQIIIGLLKIGFFFGGVIAACYAIYLGYPILVKKYQEKTKVV